MRTTLGTLQKNVLLLLNEASDSVVGDLDSATAGSPTQTTLATLTEMINHYMARLCKTCYAFEDTGTYTYPSGTLTVPYSSLTTTLGGTLWAASSVSWNGASLTQTQKAYVKINYPTLLTDATSTSKPPLYWYQEGQSGVGLAPAPATSATIQVWGYATPAPLVEGTDVASFVQDDEMLYICYGVASEIARKNNEDANMSIKLMPWTMEYNAAAQRLWVRLLQVSPAVGRAYFSPPAAAAQISESNPQ